MKGSRGRARQGREPRWSGSEGPHTRGLGLGIGALYGRRDVSTGYAVNKSAGKVAYPGQGGLNRGAAKREYGGVPGGSRPPHSKPSRPCSRTLPTQRSLASNLSSGQRRSKSISGAFKSRSSQKMVQKGLNSEHFMTVGALSIQSRSLLGRRGFGNGDGEGMGTVGRRAKSMARARGLHKAFKDVSHAFPTHTGGQPGYKGGVEVEDTLRQMHIKPLDKTQEHLASNPEGSCSREGKRGIFRGKVSLTEKLLLDAAGLLPPPKRKQSSPIIGKSRISPKMAAITPHTLTPPQPSPASKTPSNSTGVSVGDGDFAKLKSSKLDKSIRDIIKQSLESKKRQPKKDQLNSSNSRRRQVSYVTGVARPSSKHGRTFPVPQPEILPSPKAANSKIPSNLFPALFPREAPQTRLRNVPDRRGNPMSNPVDFGEIKVEARGVGHGHGTYGKKRKLSGESNPEPWIMEKQPLVSRNSKSQSLDHIKKLSAEARTKGDNEDGGASTLRRKQRRETRRVCRNEGERARKGGGRAGEQDTNVANSRLQTRNHNSTKEETATTYGMRKKSDIEIREIEILMREFGHHKAKEAPNVYATLRDRIEMLIGSMELTSKAIQDRVLGKRKSRHVALPRTNSLPIGSHGSSSKIHKHPSNTKSKNMSQDSRECPMSPIARMRKGDDYFLSTSDYHAFSPPLSPYMKQSQAPSISQSQSLSHSHSLPQSNLSTSTSPINNNPPKAPLFPIPPSSHFRASSSHPSAVSPGSTPYNSPDAKNSLFRCMFSDSMNPRPMPGDRDTGSYHNKSSKSLHRTNNMRGDKGSDGIHVHSVDVDVFGEELAWWVRQLLKRKRDPMRDLGAWKNDTKRKKYSSKSHLGDIIDATPSEMGGLSISADWNSIPSARKEFMTRRGHDRESLANYEKLVKGLDAYNRISSQEVTCLDLAWRALARKNRDKVHNQLGISMDSLNQKVDSSLIMVTPKRWDARLVQTWCQKVNGGKWSGYNQAFTGMTGVKLMQIKNVDELKKLGIRQIHVNSVLKTVESLYRAEVGLAKYLQYVQRIDQRLENTVKRCRKAVFLARQCDRLAQKEYEKRRTKESKRMMRLEARMGRSSVSPSFDDDESESDGPPPPSSPYPSKHQPTPIKSTKQSNPAMQPSPTLTTSARAESEGYPLTSSPIGSDILRKKDRWRLQQRKASEIFKREKHNPVIEKARQARNLASQELGTAFATIGKKLSSLGQLREGLIELMK
ncbi:hypothetical protein AAMO2058_000968900 [Amorphochlora amoebiformis]